jgi:glucoamylase
MQVRLSQNIFFFFALALVGTSLKGVAAPPSRSSSTSPGISTVPPFFWSSARKDAIGTAFEMTTAQSPVWWTVADSQLTEIYYPQVDSIQVSALKLLFRFPKEQPITVDQLQTKVEYLGPGMVTQITLKDPQHRFTAYQQILSDPKTARLQSRIALDCRGSCPKVFVYFKPSIQGRATQSILELSPTGVQAYGPQDLQSPIAYAQVQLYSRTGWRMMRLENDDESLPNLRSSRRNRNGRDELSPSQDRIGPGSVRFIGELQPSSTASEEGHSIFEIALTFESPRSGPSAGVGPWRSWESVEREFARGWRQYLVQTVKTAPWLKKDHLAQRSIQLLKMHGDKIHQGAFIAAFSIPGIPDLARAYESYGGYHLVWPRDLYQIATGFMAVEDWSTVKAITDYLFTMQLPEGHWPQNFWLNGQPSWTSLQMDEVGYPILLVEKIQQKGLTPSGVQLQGVRRAADFIRAHGPRTPQERWEELAGYSPDSIAVQIAALRAAAHLLGDDSLADLAQSWDSQIENWVLVKKGYYGSHYYLRISPNGTPDRYEPLKTVHGYTVPASSILDTSFLSLVRWNLRPAHDDFIRNTLELIDDHDDLTTDGYVRRYNGDHYGWNRQGGYWPLLTGERAEYEFWLGNQKGADRRLMLFQRSQTSQGHLPEQIDRVPDLEANDHGTAFVPPNSASPLAWAHASYLRLLRLLRERSSTSNN